LHGKKIVFAEGIGKSPGPRGIAELEKPDFAADKR